MGRSGMRLSSAALISRPESSASQKHPTAAAAMDSFTCCIRRAYSEVQAPTEVSTPTYKKKRAPKSNKGGEYHAPEEPVSCGGGGERLPRIIASHNPRPATATPKKLGDRS